MAGQTRAGPFDKGFLAFIKGVSQTRCPYPAGTGERQPG